MNTRMDRLFGDPKARWTGNLALKGSTLPVGWEPTT